MFQKNLPRNQEKSAGFSAHAAPAPPVALYKLKQQCQYGVDQRGREYTLGRAVPVRIDIVSEQPDIQQQARHGHRRDLGLVGPQKAEEIAEGERGVELHEIIDDKADDRGHQSQHHS